MDCADRDGMAKVFQNGKFDTVVHLAAQAGVRYSLDHPFAYLEANLNGFLTVLEGCRHHGIKHLVYASSSSVYGSNQNLPFSVADNVDHPISLYAATKKSNEHMAHVYATCTACRVRVFASSRCTVRGVARIWRCFCLLYTSPSPRDTA